MAEPQRVLPWRVSDWAGQSWIADAVLRDLYGYDTHVGLVIRIAPRNHTGEDVYLELESYVSAVDAKDGTEVGGWWLRRLDPNDVDWDNTIDRLLDGK
jgi:hypothetical protein